MHIVVTGGGTGGHVFPALEIAKQFLAQTPPIKVTFVGNFGGFEERQAKNCGITFYGLTTKKVVGQSLLNKFIALCYLKLAILKCMWFLLRHRPQAVVGVGGFVSVPMLVASFLLGIHRYICEQNVSPGLANKLLARISKRIFISFAESAACFPTKTLLTGNPIRPQFFALAKTAPSEHLRILVTGGSLGAQFLNAEVPHSIIALKKMGLNFAITHQTGAAKLGEVLAHYQKAGIDAQVVPFIDNMPESFRHHDVLISRAGATVAAEIMAAGMPAILVPYRFANGHQKGNAVALEKLGAALMVEEGPDFREHLTKTLLSLFQHPETLVEIGKKAKLHGTPKAAATIVETVINDL